jgi:predicted transcriptional regulator
MADETSIPVSVSADTFGAIQTIAARHGVSTERFASDVIRRVAEEEAELLAGIEEGRRQIAAGDYLTHEELVSEIRRWKRDQRPPA